MMYERGMCVNGACHFQLPTFNRCNEMKINLNQKFQSISEFLRTLKTNVENTVVEKRRGKAALESERNNMKTHAVVTATSTLMRDRENIY